MRKNIVFLVAMVPPLVGHIASTSASVAFPTMISHFETSLVLAGWVLTIYQLVSIGAIPTIAKMSDTVGRRSTLMFCLVFFTSGSLLCAVAPNIGWLILFRAIQGIGGGGFIAAATGIISEHYADMRPRYIGMMISISTVGSIVGPGIGGVMVETLGWQSIFWVNVPIGVISIILARLYIRRDVKKKGHGNLDFLGIGLLTGFVTGGTIAFTLLGANYDAPLSLVVTVALLGVACFGIFLYRAWSGRGRVFSWEMLSSRPFLSSNIFNMAYGACSENGVMTLLPLYATSVYGMNALQSGLITTPRSVGVMISSFMASFFIMRWGYRKPILAGTLTAAVAIFLLATEPGRAAFPNIGISPFVIVMVLGMLSGIGAGLVTPAANNACIDLMPEKAASITGLRQIFRRTGQTFGIAVATLVLQSSSSIAQGFTVVMLIFCGLLLLSIIAVYFMPVSPKC